MFGSLFRWAQATVDGAIDQMVNRALVAIPFLIAAGFCTAALAMRLNREFGPEAGSLVVAGGFAVLGLLMALVVHLRSDKSVAYESEEEPATVDAQTAAAAETAGADVDRELMMAALRSAAPMAIPVLLRTVGRNLPLIAAVAAAAFMISRDNGHEGGHGALEPGE